MISLLNKIFNNPFLDKDVPLFSLCLFRVGFCLLLCAQSLTWLPYTKELFSNQGFHQGALSMYALSPVLAKILCIVLIAAAFLSAIGFKTRGALLATLIIWTYFFSIDFINEKAFHSIAILDLLILVFSPCYVRFSVDDWLNAKNKQRDYPLSGSIMPLRLLQLQFCQVYFFSGLFKLMSKDWVSGHTLSQILTSRWATDFGVWIASWTPDAVFYFASVIIILYELFASLGLFIPQTRNYFIIFGIIFHALTLSALYVGYLGLYCILGLIVLFFDQKRLNDFIARAA